MDEENIKARCRCGIDVKDMVPMREQKCHRCGRAWKAIPRGEVGMLVKCVTKDPGTASWNRVESGPTGSEMVSLGASFDRDQLSRDRDRAPGGRGA